MPNASAVRVAPKLGYVKQLDGLRAASICAVMIVHMANGKRLGKGGWIGVDVFFVLSGFLITVLLLEDGRKRRGGRPSLPRFYLRRAFRLMPAFFAFLGLALLFAAIFRSSDYGIWAHDLYMAATYRMDFYALGHATVDGLGPTWTLCLEEQFYLVWPITLILLSAVVSRRGVMGFVAGGVVTSFLISIVLYSHHVGALRLYVGPDTNAAPLLLGCLLGLAFNGGYLHRLSGTSFARWFPACFMVLLGGWTLFIGNNTPAVFIGPTLVFCILAAAAIACLTLEQGSLAARLLGARPIVWIGKISYSLYLWNELVLKLAPKIGPGFLGKAVIGLVLTFVIASGSYYLIEQPFQRLKRTLDRRLSRAPTRTSGPSGKALQAPSGVSLQ
jgi:peptidoglycan/LPS O-acetylase OafA/YrhL